MPKSNALLAATRESPIVPSISDAAPALRSDGRLRCLVESTSWRSLPTLDGVDYEIDPRTDCDMILIPGEPEASTISRLLAEVESPAPVIIARSEALAGRADLLLSDWSAPSLAAAIRSLWALTRRVSALPRLPGGSERSGLTALSLAYTRSCSLSPSLRTDDPALVEYPLLFGIGKVRGVLEQLADAGMLRRDFFERFHVCNHCMSSRLHAREVCVKCHSGHLVERSLIHHYRCGWQAPQPQFENDDAYVCPKCRKELLHFGVDYDKPGTLTCCKSCSETMTEPNVEFLCLDCGRSTPTECASAIDWHDYQLLPDGIAAVKAGTLWEQASAEDARRERKLRDFKLLVNHVLSIAKRTGRPVSAARLMIPTGELASTIGNHGVTAVCELVRDIAAQHIREYDISVTLPGTVLICMPETDHQAARVVVDRFNAAILAAVRPELNMEVEVFPLSRIDQLLPPL